VPGVKVDWRPDAPSPWGMTVRGPLDVSRLSGLGWRARYDIDSGLAAYLDWIRKEQLA